MSKFSNRLRNMINGSKWVVGGQNFDEDLHFSSFYIRLSTKRYLNKNRKAGYSTVVGIYSDFNETYYVPRSECEEAARYLIARMIKQPLWMEHVLAEIRTRCDELRTVFDGFDIDTNFYELSQEQIVELYERHFDRHWKLYEVARIPEALDRGTEIFTGYLREYLRKRTGITDIVHLNDLFYSLTAPRRRSVFQEEAFEFGKIVSEARSAIPQDIVSDHKDLRLLIKANPLLLEKIRTHRAKWGFLEYHGYSQRKLPDLDDYIHRIVVSSRSRAYEESRTVMEKTYQAIEEEQKRLSNKFALDSAHRQIFSLYSEIGLTKLLRKFAQLRNFFFLDKLLYQIALRNGCEEAIVRCLLPEEIRKLLKNRLLVDNKIRKRLDLAVFVISDRSEHLLSGSEYDWVKKLLDHKIAPLTESTNGLVGTPASLGYARGICKVINRSEEAISKSFRSGEILVSESTNPDMLPVILKAGGVVTQRGGVTSHAAIVCRELKKPAIVGVGGLLHYIRDYDEAVLDAYAGRMRILRRSVQLPAL